MSSNLAHSLRGSFPECCFLPGTSYSAEGRTFSIKKQGDEEIVGLELDSLPPGFFCAGEAVADALFVSRKKGSTILLVTIVELKGREAKHGLNQVVDTAQRLCQGGRWKLMAHSEELIGWARSAGLNGHAGKILGIIVTKRSLPKKQFEKALAKVNDQIIMRSKTTMILNTDLNTLYSWAGLRG